MCMAYCRTALLVHLTIGITLFFAQSLLSVSSTDEPSRASSQQDLGVKQQRALLSRLEGTKANTRHGMTAPYLRTARQASVAASGSTAASVVAEVACGSGWLYCSSASRRKRCRNSSISGSNSGGSSRSISWDTKVPGCGGRGRRALSLLAPAVAPRAGTSALFVVSNARPAAAPSRVTTTRNTITLPAASAASAAAATPLLAAERARCR